MNISTLEDWARQNSRQPEHYEQGEMKSSGEPTVDAARRHLAPVIQLLQWLQCFSSLGADDLEALVGTLQQLKSLTPQQLIHTATHYRPEVGEKGLPKSATKYLVAIQKEAALRRERNRASIAAAAAAAAASPPATPGKQTSSSTSNGGAKTPTAAATPSTPNYPPLTPQTAASFAAGTASTVGGGGGEDGEDEDEAPPNLLLDPAFMLPFTLPSVTDMLVSFGAGFGGVNRERERKYIPSVPAEFLERIEGGGGGGGNSGGGGGSLGGWE
jgi:hypothetical protein